MTSSIQCTCLLLTLLVSPLASHGAPRGSVPGAVDLSQLSLRCRVTALKPEVPVRVFWRFGGEGQGGSVIHGEFTRIPRKVPDAPRDLPVAGAKKPAIEVDLVDDLLKSDAKPAAEDKITVEGKSWELVYLKLNTWSPPLTLAQLAPGGSRPAVHTITLQPYGDGAADGLRDVAMEFELSYQGKVIKRFTEIGPLGPTVGVALGLRYLRTGMSPTDPRFVDEVCGLAEYSLRRANDLAALPWAARPTPKLYPIVTDCGGLGTGAGYGVRTTNIKVMENEFRTLSQLGVNGLRGAPPEVIEMANRREGWAANFTRARISGSMGYPVPSADRDEETRAIISVPDGAGDPFYPGAIDRARPQIQDAVTRMLSNRGFDEVWGLTQDEIGCVFDRSAEGKNLIYTSPHCIAALREFMKRSGVTPADVDAKTWDEVDPWISTAPRPLNGTQLLAKQKDDLYQKTLGFKVRIPGEGEETTEKDDIVEDLAAAAAAKPATGGSAEVPSRLSPKAEGLMRYYASSFVNYASATAFSPLRDAAASANAAKQQALASGESETDVARQPWVYSYALRGQTFIRRHSLDFFEFYRHADNAIVYETSHTNRLTQIFDSYICDVGRIVSQTMDKKFGIYVKPHRGSGNQRAMSFVARGGTMLYWYTYGPAWKKGDSFSENSELLHNVSRFARILARAEDVLYGAEWAERPQVAIVKPRTTTLLGGRIDNALWNYAALAHAHVPVDPLDEVMLEHDDLSHYKVIYVGGEMIRRAAAVKLAEWVRSGGTLYTSDQGMSLDEARQPLIDVLGPVFGLKTRGAWEVPDKDRPVSAGAILPASGDYAGGFTPEARELLELNSTAEAVVRFADGKPAVVRNRHGQGTAYLVAFAAGDEYGKRLGASVPAEPYSMEQNADAGLRHYVVAAALERIKVPVEVSRANVEAIRVRHPKSGRQAIPLINWAYERQVEERLHVSQFRDVVVTLAAGPNVTKVTSAWLDRELPIQRIGERLQITLPELLDCDVLLLE